MTSKIDTTDSGHVTRVLTALVDGPLSATDIGNRTRIAITILRRILDGLADDGQIQRADAVATPGRPGRRPVLWELVPTRNVDGHDPVSATAPDPDIPTPTPDPPGGDATGPSNGRPLDTRELTPGDTPTPDAGAPDPDTARGDADDGLGDEASCEPSDGDSPPIPDLSAATPTVDDPTDPDPDTTPAPDDDEGDPTAATPQPDLAVTTGSAHPDGPDDAASLASTGTGSTAAPVSGDTTDPDPDSQATGEDPRVEDEPAPAAPREDDTGAVEVDTATSADEQSLDAGGTPPGQVGVAAGGVAPGEVPVCAALACPLAACPVRTGTPAPPSRARSRDRGGATKDAPALNASGSVRLAPGALGRLVEELLVGNPEAQLTAGEIARELGRSSGAVTAAMPKLISSGKAIQVDPGSRPARYQTAAKA